MPLILDTVRVGSAFNNQIPGFPDGIFIISRCETPNKLYNSKWILRKCNLWSTISMLHSFLNSDNLVKILAKLKVT